MKDEKKTRRQGDTETRDVYRKKFFSPDVRSRPVTGALLWSTVPPRLSVLF